MRTWPAPALMAIEDKAAVLGQKTHESLGNASEIEGSA